MLVQVGELKSQLNASTVSIGVAEGKFSIIDKETDEIEHELRRITSDIGKHRCQEWGTNPSIVLDAVKKELENSISFIETQGRSELERARTAAERFGDRSQRLTELAEEAKRFADKQSATMKQIKELAERASNASRQAVSEANEAIFGTRSTSQQIANLQSAIKETEGLLNQTKQLAEEMTAESQVCQCCSGGKTPRP
jgi:uncharacterized protein YoxC